MGGIGVYNEILVAVLLSVLPVVSFAIGIVMGYRLSKGQSPIDYFVPGAKKIPLPNKGVNSFARDVAKMKTVSRVEDR